MYSTRVVGKSFSYALGPVQPRKDANSCYEQRHVFSSDVALTKVRMSSFTTLRKIINSRVMLLIDRPNTCNGQKTELLLFPQLICSYLILCFGLDLLSNWGGIRNLPDWLTYVRNVLTANLSQAYQKIPKPTYFSYLSQ